MLILTGILVILVIILIAVLWKYQRQVKDICRQLQFQQKHDSNMMISREIDYGGIGELTDTLNDFLAKRKQESGVWLEKERIISDTYTNLSHDIRTPLTSLDGYFQLLEESRSEEEKERYLRIIQERIGSLKDMLEELFTFTKLKNESFQLELSCCCVNRILKETIFSYYENWKAQGIEPQIQITEELLYIEGNAQALRRVIQNIIKNALDHGEKKISISLQCIEQQIQLEIRNQTAQPEQIDVSQVFERFYKADSARSKNSTGLGLSIAKEFVIRMHGQIRAFVEEDEFCIAVSFLQGEQD
ncbi:MAG: HAMP domain-containing sensor histidine kinase [Eubacteriales bacterium]|nr:HAMP domain-containing sensor histidine kinase [Eubacteriales bacterium]